MDILILLILIVLPALTIVAALTDVTTMKIPNWISLALIVSFFPAALLTGLAPMTILIHVGIGIAALLIGMVLFAFRVIGGGDAKLLAATCLWMGLTGSGPFIVWTALVGGFLSLGLLMARQHARPFVIGAPAWVETLMEPKGDIPYGTAIAVGALIAYPASPLVVAFVGS